MEITGYEALGFAIADTMSVSSTLFWDMSVSFFSPYLFFWHYVVGPAHVTCGFVSIKVEHKIVGRHFSFNFIYFKEVIFFLIS